MPRWDEVFPDELLVSALRRESVSPTSTRSTPPTPRMAELYPHLLIDRSTYSN